MRYNLESTLPINAFSPRGGRSPFNHGMTLEGGGGGVVGKVIGGAAKAVTNVVKGVVQPVYNATHKNIPGVDSALVNLDKSVGKAIPGGWGTVASVAASFIPGSQLALMGMTKTGLATGLGALTGSGVMRGAHKFNLHGAIMGGAMAYGASQIAAGLEEAGKATADAGTNAASNTTTSAIENATESALKGTSSAAPAGIGTSVTPTANALQNAASDFSALSNAPTAAQAFPTPAGSDFGLKNLATNTSIPSGDFGLNPAASVPSGLGTSAPAGMLDKIASGASNVASGTGSNIAQAGQGIANLAGFGAGEGTAAAARSAFTTPITTAGLAGLTMGGAGLTALEEQQKYLDSQLASGSIAQAEYDTAKAKIDAQVATANQTVSANPLKTSADIENISEGPSLYAKNTTGFNTLYDKEPTGGSTLYEKTYAMGGVVNPLDDQTGLASISPMTRFEQGGVTSMIDNTVPQQTFAAGGMPRFLSGGGDGMSDSIKANIEGSQEARLADGEFVIPADVVSHIGNGSSKAGAKQLYSMMDRVRQARVGTKKQGKQINPRKYLAA